MPKMTVKKKPSKAPKGLHPFRVKFGTRNEFGEMRSYPTSSKAKQAIVKELDAWKPWCIRYNSAGLDAILAAKAESDNIIFHRAPSRIECCFDTHFDMWLVAEYWMAE